MEEPRSLSLSDHGQHRDRRTGDEPAGHGEVSRPIRYERCLDSYVNDVLNQDTLSSTIKPLVTLIFPVVFRKRCLIFEAGYAGAALAWCSARAFADQVGKYVAAVHQLLTWHVGADGEAEVAVRCG